jgi:hypothetical protein
MGRTGLGASICLAPSPLLNSQLMLADGGQPTRLAGVRAPECRCVCGVNAVSGLFCRPVAGSSARDTPGKIISCAAGSAMLGPGRSRP